MRPAALAASALVAVGCGGAPPAVSPAAPRDPTPLARCRVAASQSSPLVTEWPASEKAHLEVLTRSGAVAVAYTGCELRLLDECRLPGAYAFQRTTLATDTLEIEDGDELYAKLPLGAASLEGELARSGRLALQTTVAGQFLLDRGEGAPALRAPEGPACAGATHVVTALSVGAFRLKSGGAVRVEVGGSGLGAGARGGARREESVLREAGDPARCAAGAGDEVDPQCRSPIQLSLAPLPGRAPSSRPLEGAPAGPPPPAPDEPPPADALRVEFRPPSSGGRWMLRGGGGAVLCQLPCTRWVGKGSGLVLHLDAASADEIRTVPVPSDLGYLPGRSLVATPELARGNVNVGGGLTVAGLGVGLGVSQAFKGGCGADGSDGACAGLIATVAGGGALFVGGIVYIFAYWIRDDRLEVRLAGDVARIELSPTGVLGSF